MPEIKELDNKYLVLKWDDIHNLQSVHKEALNKIIDRIQENRENQNKPRSNDYLIMNLDDEINWDYLTNRITVVYPDYRKLKVKDIAVALINAIIKAKEE